MSALAKNYQILRMRSDLYLKWGMQIAGAILVCIGLGYFWIWLIQQLFVKERKKFSFALLGTSVFLVASLWGFGYVMQNIAPSLEVSLPWFGYFLVYCGLIFLFLVLITANYKSKHLWFLFLVWLVMFAVVGFLGFMFGVSLVVVYYLVSAYAEEFLKIGATQNAVNKTDFYSSDVLFFSVLVALGFSIVENLLYLFQQFAGLEGSGFFSLAVGRGIFSSLLHLIATGLVALLLYKYYQRIVYQWLSLLQKFWRVALCLLVGVVVHLCYNLAVEYGQSWVYVVLVVGGYFLLTYLMFLSDTVYKERDSRKKIQG